MKKTIKLEKIHLNISDVKKMKDFYSTVLKLVLSYEDEKVLKYSFNENEEACIELHICDDITSNETASGLYHFAILLETREALASILYHLAISKYDIVGAADHLVSEAIYLKDPEGNDIEIYCDTPENTWIWNNNRVHMETLPLKAEELIAIAKAWNGFPPQTTIGHVHFYVKNIQEADFFFMEILGFDLVATLSEQAHFYSHNKYHHHVGANIWKGTNLTQHTDTMFGLFKWEIKVDEQYYLEIKGRLALNNYAYTEKNQVLIIMDVVGATLEIKK